MLLCIITRGNVCKLCVMGSRTFQPLRHHAGSLVCLFVWFLKKTSVETSADQVPFWVVYVDLGTFLWSLYSLFPSDPLSGMTLSWVIVYFEAFCFILFVLLSFSLAWHLEVIAVDQAAAIEGCSVCDTAVQGVFSSGFSSSSWILKIQGGIKILQWSVTPFSHKTGTLACGGSAIDCSNRAQNVICSMLLVLFYTSSPTMWPWRESLCPRTKNSIDQIQSLFDWKTWSKLLI